MIEDKGIQELEQTYVKWRMAIMRINALLVVFGVFVEVTMFFVLKDYGLILQPMGEYFKWFLIIPTVLNILILLIGWLLSKVIYITSRWGNYLPVVQLGAICTVLASIHNIFSVSLCFFCFPLFVSAIFGDRRMIRHMAWLNFLFLLIALMFRRYWIYKPENDVYFLPEALVACAILAAAIVFAGMIIGFQEEKTKFINMGLRQQIEMQDQLNRDQQTGLHGQTLFINTLRQMVDQVDHPMQLVVIDIDDFKRVNDSYGHLRGDEIIRKLAGLMKEIFQHEYFISRYGGEEFTIICKDTDLEYLVGLLEKLRIAFESHSYEFMEELVTISIGIAQYQPGWSAERLFEAADQAMYVSKREGKNRISIYKQ